MRVEQTAMFGKPRRMQERAPRPWVVTWCGLSLGMPKEGAKQAVMLGQISYGEYGALTRWCALVPTPTAGERTP